ncbi:MAG: sugar transferase [Actinomycetota bacterium]|nr:sugar transferase [Actinomycetota bacterium]
MELDRNGTTGDSGIVDGFHSRVGSSPLDGGGDVDLETEVEADAVVFAAAASLLEGGTAASSPLGVPLRSSPGVRRVTWALVLSDFLATSVAVVLGLVLLSLMSSVTANSLDHLATNLRTDSLIPPATLLAFFTYGLYRTGHRRLRPSAFGEVRDVIHGGATGAFVALGVSVVLHRLCGFTEIPPSHAAMIASVGVGTTLLGRSITRRSLSREHSRRVRVVVLGTGMMAERVCRYLANEPGIQLVGQVDDDPVPGAPTLGPTAALPAICREHRVDRVLVSFSQTHPRQLVDLLRPLQGQVQISIVPRYFELLSWRSQVDEIRGLPVIDVAPPHLNFGARFAKRTFDIVVASALLTLASPFLAVFALAIKAGSPGPVLFRQERIGRDRKPFTIYKLRSMRETAEAEHSQLGHQNEVDGPLFKVREDPRITPIGRFLRRTSLDELPQLINVLAGHMSLVGPRPFVTSEAQQIQDWAGRRFETKPGLTGLWQVSGRSDLTFDELCRLDYLYVASWSLLWDAKILWQTPAAVLRREGAY